jgi:hypothetical protein
MTEQNQWTKMVGHRGCIYPCSGHPVLKTSPGKVRVEADEMPAYLKCSECGYTPLSKIQPGLVAKFLEWWLKQKSQTVKPFTNYEH